MEWNHGVERGAGIPAAQLKRIAYLIRYVVITELVGSQIHIVNKPLD